MAPFMDADTLLNGSPRPGTPAEDATMPIAVVGIGWRGPGDATNVENFYNMLAEGREARNQGHQGKWNNDAHWHPDGGRKGTTNVEAGHYFTRDLSLWDAPFFSMTNAEASCLDPQQRLLLETCYEAFENSGTSIEQVAGSSTAVYVGTFGCDSTDMLLRDPESMPLYQTTNSGHSRAIISNRLSHFYDLRGPSVTVDTACSAGLVAFHQACQAIRTGDARQAVCGGSSVILSSDLLISMSAMRFLSPDGRCYSFDERANGYARGEGVGCIFIKRLDDALANGDTIRAIVRNTGSNQDGRTPGISFPSQEAQKALATAVYERARLSPLDTSYVEAHGTGTQAGDPIETGALASSMAKERDPSSPLTIGSVKANIGHLEGASGVAGLIKCILMLENQVIFPQRNFNVPNKRIPLEEWKLRVPVKMEPWVVDGARRLSINSFGYGGTNAHAILEDAPGYFQSHELNGSFTKTFSLLQAPSAPDANTETPPASGRSRVFVLSAFDEAAVKRQAENLAIYLKSRLHLADDKFLDNLAYTLNNRRTSFKCKAILSATSASDLIEGLEQGRYDVSKASKKPVIGFVFTGQGAQWAGMGKELMDVYPVYAKTLHQCRDHLKSIGAEWDLIEELNKDAKETRINLAMFSQPLCSAVQIGLIELLSSWGISADSVTGHSSGEIASAYAVGALSLEDAMTAAYYRGVVSNDLANSGKVNGAMMAVGMSREDAKPYLEALTKGKAVIACVNSPSSLTISGDMTAIDELQAILESKKIFARKLAVQMAYHSHHMGFVGEDYNNAISAVKPKADGTVEFFSSVTGQKAEHKDLGPSYWVSNLLGTVEFASSLHKLCYETSGAGSRRKRRGAANPSVNVLVELGPHSALAGPAKQILQADEKLKGAQIKYLSALVRKQSAASTVIDLASKLINLGYPVNLAAANMTTNLKLLHVLNDLPPYSWNHSTSYWAESRLSKAYRWREHARIDLLGAPETNFNPLQPRWRNYIRSGEIPWVKDHKIQSNVVYPAAGYIAMAIEAVNQQAASKSIEVSGFSLREISIGQALIVPEQTDEVETLVALKPMDEGTRASSDTWQEWFVYSVTDDNRWTEHARGLISMQKKNSANEIDGEVQAAAEREELRALIEDIDGRCTNELDVKDFYQKLTALGLDYGPTFANMKAAKNAVNACTAELDVPDIAAVMPMQFQYPHVIHPSTLDAIFHPIFAALAGSPNGLKDPAVPVLIKSLNVSASMTTSPGDKLNVYARAADKEYRQIEAALDVVEASDPTLSKVKIEGMICKVLANDNEGAADNSAKDMAFNLSWEPDVEHLSKDAVVELCEPAKTPEYSSQEASFRVKALQYLQKALNEVPEADIPAHLRDFAKASQLMVAAESSESALDTAKNDAESRLLEFIGPQLPDILAGKKELPKLLEETTLLDQFFAEASSLQFTYAKLAAYLNLLGHKNPQMRILEIGAGAGRATHSVLSELGGAGSKLPRFSKYDIVANREGPLEKMKERLAPWSDLIEYKTINLDEEMEGQGIDAETYDVILTANLSFGLKNPKDALSKLKGILKPEGTMLMMELTGERASTTALFGAEASWWTGNGINGSHIMPLDKWDELLKGAGFSTASSISSSREETESVLLVKASTAEPKPVQQELLLIVESGNLDSVSLGALQAKLSEKGFNVTTSDMLNAQPEGKICVVFSELTGSQLQNPSQELFNAVKNMFLTGLGSLWVSEKATSGSPIANMGLGLARTVRSESSGSSILTLDLENAKSQPAGSIEIAISELVTTHFCHVIEDTTTKDSEYRLTDGRLFVPRLTRDSETNKTISRLVNGPTPEDQPFFQPGRPLRIEVGSPGLLDSLYYVDDELMAGELAEDNVEVEVKACGFNFRDVMMAMGQIAVETLGGECSGVVTKVGKNVQGLEVGDRVSCIHLGTFCNYIRTPATAVQKLPVEMSFEVGAALAVVYITAYYSIYNAANLQKGESILIHAASGGLGQAAIPICQNIGAEVFVTVGSNEKKKLLMDRFGLPEDHIFSSRDGSFATGVKRMTKGQGVDVILNSLAGEALRLTWSCIAPFGRFIELGKRDFFINTRLEMQQFAKNVTFAAVDLVDLIKVRPAVVGRVWESCMDLLRAGKVPAPSPITVYGMSEIEKGLKVMQSGKHTGKLVAVPKPGEIVQAIPAKSEKALFKSDASYLLVGGLGGIGRATALWMVKNGAKSLVFANRSGDSKPEAKETLAALEKAGAKGKVFACDVSNAESVKAMSEEAAATLAPIRGVIQGAMVLRDQMVEKMSSEDFNAVCRPKVDGTLNLHEYLPREMDFFIMLSSISGVIGNASQGAYAAANTFLDAFAGYRNSLGLPAVTLDLGVIGGVGHVAEHKELAQAMERQGFQATSEKELMALLTTGVSRPHRDATSSQIITGMGTWSEGALGNFELPLFSHFRRMARRVEGDGAGAGGESIRKTLAKSKTLDEAVQTVCRALISKVSLLTMTPEDSISEAKPMTEYGMDSLVAVEMRNWIFKEMDCSVAILELLANQSLLALSGKVAEKSRLIDTKALGGEAK